MIALFYLYILTYFQCLTDPLPSLEEVPDETGNAAQIYVPRSANSGPQKTNILIENKGNLRQEDKEHFLRTSRICRTNRYTTAQRQKAYGKTKAYSGCLLPNSKVANLLSKEGLISRQSNNKSTLHVPSIACKTGSHSPSNNEDLDII